MITSQTSRVANPRKKKNCLSPSKEFQIAYADSKLISEINNKIFRHGEAPSISVLGIVNIKAYCIGLNNYLEQGSTISSSSTTNGPSS